MGGESVTTQPPCPPDNHSNHQHLVMTIIDNVWPFMCIRRPFLCCMCVTQFWDICGTYVAHIWGLVHEHEKKSQYVIIRPHGIGHGYLAHFHHGGANKCNTLVNHMMCHETLHKPVTRDPTLYTEHTHTLLHYTKTYVSVSETHTHIHTHPRSSVGFLFSVLSQTLEVYMYVNV